MCRETGKVPHISVLTIQYDLDAQGNIIVDGAYLNLALMHIRSMGIEAELVNGKEETEK